MQKEVWPRHMLVIMKSQNAWQSNLHSHATDSRKVATDHKKVESSSVTKLTGLDSQQSCRIEYWYKAMPPSTGMCVGLVFVLVRLKLPFPPMRKPLCHRVPKIRCLSMLLTSPSLPPSEHNTAHKKRGVFALRAYHCVEAAGGVAVRRGPLPLSFHLRLPTRVSRCDGMALLSCPAVTIMLLCLFRYASTDIDMSTQVDYVGNSATYVLAVGILADHQTPASGSKPCDSQSH